MDRQYHEFQRNKYLLVSYCISLEWLSLWVAKELWFSTFLSLTFAFILTLHVEHFPSILILTFFFSLISRINSYAAFILSKSVASVLGNKNTENL